MVTGGGGDPTLKDLDPPPFALDHLSFPGFPN